MIHSVTFWFEGDNCKVAKIQQGPDPANALDREYVHDADAEMPMQLAEAVQYWAEQVCRERAARREAAMIQAQAECMAAWSEWLWR